MSDEVTNDEVVQTAPQLQKRGRSRTRPIQDWKAVAEKQADMLEKQGEQIERLMSLVVHGQAGNGNPLQAFLPVKPQPISRPEGYRYMLKRIKESDNDDEAVHPRDVPARPDNPNEPDPRYCVFCRQNVPALYGHKISGTPTPQEEEVIKQCFIMHQQDAMSKKTLQGAKFEKERRYAADHTEFTVTRWGRVPNAVANFMGKEWTAEEWNERELKIWEDKCRKVGLGMAQGGS